jgi:hypothetical protein
VRVAYPKLPCGLNHKEGGETLLALSGELQSEEIISSTSVTEETTSVTARFLDETPGTSQDLSTPAVTNLNDMQDTVELAQFLSRPVLIKTITWAETDSYTTGTTWDPWHLFFNSTPIKNKVNNYAFINCKLKLKFVINASPFYSGAMAFCYSPLVNLRGSTIKTDSISTGSEIMEYSQQPKVWVFPQTNQGGELILPFFYHKNWLNLTSAQDMRDMGTITPVLFANLTSALGVSGTSVIINVYAWAEDVKLHAPTTKLALQGDEYDYKPSQMASAVSKASGMLSNIPLIGPYMKATSIVSSAMSSIASMFGYTNVPNIDTVAFMRPAPFPQFSSCEISTPMDRLCVDPKNEVTLDPRTVGLSGIDELDISYISQRECYLGNAILSSTDAVDALTMVSRVTPNLVYQYNSISPIHFTPMAYTSEMFNHWRGDIVFRFKFVCTKFHKGRVRITFDPVNDISTTVPDYTTVFNEIVDIGCDQDIEITVPYMQATTFLKSVNVAGNYNFSGTALSPSADANGLLTMRVVNPLSGPSSPTAIPVMIFVRAGDNFELAQPKITNQGALNLSPYALQSDEVSYPLVPKHIIAGHSCNLQDPNRNLVHFGETLKSFRPLLHRPVLHNVYYTSEVTSRGNVMSKFFSRVPQYAGYDPSGINTANGTLVPGSTFAYNFTKMNMHQLISLLFIGQRGSVNWYMYDDNSTPCIQLKRTTEIISPSSYNISDSVSTAVSNNTATASTMTIIRDFNSGVAVGGTSVNAFVNANIPYYNRYNFMFVNPLTATLGSAVDGSDQDNVVYQTHRTTVSNSTFCTVRSFSYGHDYNFFFFINTPSLYLYTQPSAP